MTEPFLEKLNEKFENDSDKINCIATLLGCSARMVEFISKNYKVQNLEPEMKYLFTLVASQVIGLTQDGKVEAKDMHEETKPYFMGEQTQERIYRTMKDIVTELYQSLQEKEVELNRPNEVNNA
jgi:hypothetical protein